MFFRKPSDHVPHVTIFHTILRSMLWILFIEIALLVGCYLLGCALAIGVLNRASTLQILGERE